MVDSTPKDLTEIQQEMLIALSRQVIQLLEFDSSVTILKEQFLAAKRSEIELRSFFESSIDCHLLLGKDFEILAFNKSLERLVNKAYGHSLKRGDQIGPYLNPELRNDFYLRYQKALKGTASFEERKLAYPEGPVWWVIKYEPAFNPDGEIIGVSVNSSDVTARVLHEEKVSVQTASLSEIAFIQSHELRRPVASIMGLMNLLKLDERAAGIEELQLMEPIFDREISIRPTAGERFYISINAAPIFDEAGELNGGIGTFMDVSERRRITIMKDEFFTIASHELKTPVTSLKGALQLLTKFKASTTDVMMPRLIDQANRSLERVDVLITALLNASKMHEGQLQLKKSVFNLSELISDCCYHIRLANLYELQTERELDLNVNADADRIEQVITNFVNNAIKHAPDSKMISLQINKTGEYAKVSVTDQGPGISPEKIGHLFNRYFKADNSGNQYSGLGLGLYISAEIIKKHGGQIGVDSRLGEGSTFWFTVPLK